ncbi:hypothetical protein DYB32_006603, partial [Aphanomyces invadans]
YAFEVESKARRARIWQHQQQLLYMESMSPVQYDRLMALQRQRAARLIQRRWKEYTLSAQYPRSMSVHHIHAWDTDDGTADSHTPGRPPPPWEIQGHDKIWTWPHSFRVTVNTVDDEAPIKGDDSDNPIDQFLTRSAASRATEDPLHQGKRNSRDMQIEMDHLWLHYAEATSLPPSAMLANVTSVMTTHPSLLACQRASGKTGGQDDVFGLSFDAIVRSKTKHLVADITNQITFNTQLRLVEDHTKNAVAKARTPMATKEDDDMELIGGVDYGRLRRHHMATRIQRRVRGNKGRAEAQEVRR